MLKEKETVSDEFCWHLSNGDCGHQPSSCLGNIRCTDARYRIHPKTRKNLTVARQRSTLGRMQCKSVSETKILINLGNFEPANFHFRPSESETTVL